MHLGIVRSTFACTNAVSVQSLCEIGSYVSPTILELHNRSYTSKPNSYFTYHQVFNVKKFYFLPTDCFYVLFINLSWNSDYIPVQH